MKMRRLISAIIALLLVVNLSVTAFAAEWYLEDGDITVSAGDSGQTVSQGSSTDVADNAPVIKQRDSSKTTDSTITISTSDNATANVTIQDINISSTGDAIDVGSSSANITLEGDNKIFSESGSALHVSDGDVTITGSGSLEAEIGDSTENENDNAIIGSHKGEDMSGKIHITGSATVTTEDDEEDDFRGDGAGIGSGEDGNMSGSITIDGNAKVNAFSHEDGAGIGSGKYGNMSGSITISDNAQVTAGSGWDGAGIGAGESAYDPQKGEMSGTITIGGNAKVTAWSEEGGTGIGSGEDGDVSGTIIIGGNARVTAGSYDESAGIGSGNDGSITSTGRIIIRDSAKVTAIGEDEGAGIGASDGEHMAGLIIIQDNAQVTAIAGDSAAAIGSDDKDDMRGTILILGNARITTGMLLNDKVAFNYKTKEIEYTLDKNAIGRIGDGQDAYHESSYGHYVIGPDVTINGRNGSDIEKLKDYINMRLSGENHDGDPENLTALDIRSENGKFTVTASGEGTVEKILYDRSETVPAAPGTYPVTCVLRLGDETIEFQIGTLVVPEGKSDDADTPQSPLYRVTDKDGKDIAYMAEQKDGVLTVTVDADFAVLTGKLSGISTLKAQGVEKIVFVTKDATSAFRLADLLEKGAAGETYKLTHDGKTAAFTAGGQQTDISDILVKA
jgi:ostA family protein